MSSRLNDNYSLFFVNAAIFVERALYFKLIYTFSCSSSLILSLLEFNSCDKFLLLFVCKIKIKINFCFSNSCNNNVNFLKINSVSSLNFSSSEATICLSYIPSIFVKNFFLIVLNKRTLENIFSGASIGHLHSQFQSILKFLFFFSIFF